LFTVYFQIVDDVTIEDAPAFPYRGIMLDTSRNFFTVPQIEKLIDGLSYNKMNIFHWHLTDSHSFPVEIDDRPEVSLVIP